jgi:cytochrome oxidase Cu insertion factor (SCO1/SenC/PrrC family)
MRTIVGVIFLVGLCAFASSHVTGPSNQAVLPTVGLEIGQQAPAFALVDQFGQQHSSETLKGSKGTVLLFFRSADW